MKIKKIQTIKIELHIAQKQEQETEERKKDIIIMDRKIKTENRIAAFLIAFLLLASPISYLIYNNLNNSGNTPVAAAEQLLDQTQAMNKKD